jgi:LPPG:FO 2-phospho-L-lactate transferase
MRELGTEPSALAVAAHYRGLIDALILDQADTQLRKDVAALGIEPVVTQTVMHDGAARRALAQSAQAAVARLRSAAAGGNR